MRKRILYSQNFLTKTDLVSKLLSLTSINKNDTVLEIGAGDGIITRGLLDISGKVIAYEVDEKLFDKLTFKFKDKRNLELKSGSFLDSQLPNFRYKVFSNIPFNITSAIIKKLTFADNPPDNVYLVVQKEATLKFIGKPMDDKNSQASVLLYPFFELEIIYQFQKSDFNPMPNVDVVFLQIRKREKPLIKERERAKYNDFVTYKFTRTKISKLNFSDWINLFHQNPKIVDGFYTKQLEQEKNLEKIHRTRLDKKWRKYK